MILVEADKPKKEGKKKTTKEGTSTAASTPKKRKEKTGSSAPAPLLTKKRKIKKATRKTRSPTPSESEHSQSNTQSDVRIKVDEPVQTEDTTATSNHEVSPPISTNPRVIFSIPFSISITNDFFENASIPSPTTTVSTLITIAPCPPLLVRRCKPLLLIQPLCSLTLLSPPQLWR